MTTKPFLNIIPAVKEITVNGKQVTIPKLGFRQMKLMKDMSETGLNESIQTLIDSIRPGLTMAEADMVMLHLLAFNKKVKTVEMVGGFEVDIDKAYLCGKYEFDLEGHPVYFIPPVMGQTFLTAVDVLEKQFDRERTGFDIDFEEAPAYVLDWASDIMKTVALDTPNGTVFGGSNIVGI
ncbi:baseplate hub distal subunit [Aeromonas phage GomatiRiver_11]|nr:baseplate hub assembly protein [Aeromonas phage AhFM11]WKW84430.1 baseplate hub distal subunit [Aeromonas phage GomatiRiver_11]